MYLAETKFSNCRTSIQIVYGCYRILVLMEVSRSLRVSSLNSQVFFLDNIFLSDEGRTERVSLSERVTQN